MTMNTTTGKEATQAAMFNAIGGWTTQFEIDGKKVGGAVDILPKDPRLIWHLETIGGAVNKRVLELGPLEGAHTKMLLQAGASEVIALEGLSDCFLRCLVVKEAFRMDRARFFFCDFNNYVANYQGPRFDFVSAAGVLYHQQNPAKLIHNLAKITDTVIVWSQVANETQPSNVESMVHYLDFSYRGRINNYKGTRLLSETYCAGLNDNAFWFYPEQMRRCFREAGFTKIIEKDSPNNVNGSSLLFVASR